MRKSVLSLICISILFMWAGNVSAFHDDGVAYCGGCHTMHNSQNGIAVDPTGPNPYLLKLDTGTDVCLSCHGTSTSRGVWYNLPYVAGHEHGAGNFCFNNEDNINDGHNGGDSALWIPGWKSGHTPVSVAKGFPTGDPTLLTAPGGDFPSDMLSCTSCHDPHGNQFFRLLNGVGDIQAGFYNFTNPAPNAVGIRLSSSTNESNAYHTGYKSGMSAWCSNCHGDYHQASEDFVHPSGEQITTPIANIYGHYNGTQHLTTGIPGTSYLAAAPFEDLANDTLYTAGPTSASQVSCISCHRAHATSAPDAGRWDFNVTLLEEDGVESGSYAIPDPYNYAEQRSLCNKCHKKDEGDIGSGP